MAEFSERFRQLRAAYGFSQQKLADLLKVSKSTVNMYERGERKPGIDQLEAIADYFNVDMDYLSGKSDIPRKSLISVEPEHVERNLDERKLIEKYRCLDDYGRNTVDLVVDAELKRCSAQSTIRSFRAASSEDNHPSEIIDMPDLSKLPESDIDDI